MSSRERNEQLLRQGVEAFNRGDLERLIVLFDPEIESHVAPGSGVPVEMTNFYLLELRDERAVRFHIYADRQAAMDAVR